MVRNRIIFGILWVLSVVGISFYGGPVSYGLFLMLTLVPVVCLIYILYVFLNYRIYQEIGTKHPVADHAVPYYITLQNEKKLLFSSIRVDFFSTFSKIEGLDSDKEYELGPHDGIRLETSLICKYRGEYEVGIKKIYITDFLRLIRVSFYNPEPLRVVVKPDIVSGAVPEDLTDTEVFLESVGGNERPDVTVREYVPGDSLRKVNWKLTARADKLLVRTDIGEEKQGVLVIPDTCRYTENEYVYIPEENRIIKDILSLSLYYVKKDIPVTLVALGQGGSLLHTTVSAEREFENYYEKVSNIHFDSNYKVEDLCVKILQAGVYQGEQFANVIVGKNRDTTALLVDTLEKSGLQVRVCKAEESNEK